MLNLLRLGRITADSALEEKAAGTGRAFFEIIEPLPPACPQLMAAVDYASGTSYELVVVGDSQADDTRKMLQSIHRKFIPNKVVIFVPAELDSPEINSIVPFTGQTTSIDGKATAYICVNYICRLPITDIGTMILEMERASMQ